MLVGFFTDGRESGQDLHRPVSMNFFVLQILAEVDKKFVELFLGPPKEPSEDGVADCLEPVVNILIRPLACRVSDIN